MNKRAAFQFLTIETYVIGFLFILLGVVVLIIGISAYGDQNREEITIDRGEYYTKDALYQLAISPLNFQDQQLTFAEALSVYIALEEKTSPSTIEEEQREELFTLLLSRAEEFALYDDTFIGVAKHSGELLLGTEFLHGGWGESAYNPSLRNENNSIALPYQAGKKQNQYLYLILLFDHTDLEIERASRGDIS